MGFTEYYTKVKTRMVTWVEDHCKCTGLLTLVITCLTRSSSCHHPASQQKIILHNTSPGKDQIKNPKYSFYWMDVDFTPLWSREIVTQTIVSQGPPIKKFQMKLGILKYLSCDCGRDTIAQSGWSNPFISLYDLGLFGVPHNAYLRACA